MAKSRASSAGELNRSPSHLLHRVLELALDLYAEESGEAAITQRQYAVLCAVSADEGLSQTGLVRATGIDRSTLADVVARMMAKDLLARQRSASDARANTVHLTEQGRSALEAVRPRVQAADARLLALLGHKKRDPFVEALRRIARAAEAALATEAKGTDAEAPEVAGKRAKDAGEKPRKAKKAKSGKKKRRELESQAELMALAAGLPADPVQESERPELKPAGLDLDVDQGAGT